MLSPIIQALINVYLLHMAASSYYYIHILDACDMMHYAMMHSADWITRWAHLLCGLCVKTRVRDPAPAVRAK